MVFQLPAVLSENFLNIAYGVIGAVATICIVAELSRSHDLDSIPTVGSSSWLGSWWAGLTFMINAPDVIRKGYAKYQPAPFKVADQYHWLVVVSDRKHLDELRRASDDELSALEGMDERLSTKHTLGHDVHETPYHTEVVRSQLTRNIGKLYSEMKDEIITAFEEVLDLRGNEWKSIPVLRATQNIVCRASNRAFVGLPLCRNPDWVDLNIQFTIDIATEGIAIAFFPRFLRPLIARFFSTAKDRGIERGVKHLGSIIEERLKYAHEYGNNWDKPNDLLSWLIEEARDLQLTARSLVTRVLIVNFAAVHSSSNTLAHTLLYLAANPQYMQPLREEIEPIIQGEGWSKAAVNKMRKVDSFLRECLRLEGVNTLGLIRKAVDDFTFSDGTFIPKGTLVSTSAESLQHDEKFYKDANAFHPFRFVDMHKLEEDGRGAKHHLVSTGLEYLPFGHGRRACPGRFFAASELKSMLAHTVMTYDVKLEDNATHPPGFHYGTLLTANPHAKVMFRKRTGKE